MKHYLEAGKLWSVAPKSEWILELGGPEKQYFYKRATGIGFPDKIHIAWNLGHTYTKKLFIFTCNTSLTGNLFTC